MSSIDRLINQMTPTRTRVPNANTNQVFSMAPGNRNCPILNATYMAPTNMQFAEIRYALMARKARTETV